jgi:hypothetical protein
LYCDNVATKEGLLLDGKIAVNFGRAAREAFILELKTTTEIPDFVRRSQDLTEAY